MAKKSEKTLEPTGDNTLEDQVKKLEDALKAAQQEKDNLAVELEKAQQNNSELTKIADVLQQALEAKESLEDAALKIKPVPIDKIKEVKTKLPAYAGPDKIAQAAGKTLEDTLAALEAATNRVAQIRRDVSEADDDQPVYVYSVYSRIVTQYLGVQFIKA
ncbi:MAG: hypothetical protein JEZ07_06445 [Phycisphaerae bacterium]|nr:hypothetical protein [Phycisphaerae bacterium]